MAIIFAIHFQMPDDQALARVMLLEMSGAMNRVKQPVTVKYHDKDVPSQLLDVFPDVKLEDYSNGFLAIRKYPTLSQSKCLTLPVV